MPSQRMARSSYRRSPGNLGFDQDSSRRAAIVGAGVIQQESGWFATHPPDPGIAPLPVSIQLMSRPFDLAEYMGALHVRYRIRALQLKTKASRTRDLHGSTTDPALTVLQFIDFIALRTGHQWWGK